MVTNYPYQKFTAFSSVLSEAYRRDEDICVQALIPQAKLSEKMGIETRALATKLIEGVRKSRLNSGGLDAFLTEYDLSSEEGIALMCLAEALLRIPDRFTADKLIADKLTHPDWASHLGDSHSLFVNASTWGLLLTGKVLNKSKQGQNFLTHTFNTLLKKQGAPFIRAAVKQGMKIMGKQFVLGQTIEEGLKHAKEKEALGFRYSYDMLGEGAKTQKDALHYQEVYKHAIHTIGKSERLQGVYQSPGISIKLSALMARYEIAQIERVFAELLPRVKELCVIAKTYDIGLTIDAEETERLQLSLALLEELALDKDLKGWNGLGLAIQAYQKRTPYTIDFLVELAKRAGRRFMVRLVKGAYWDSEIKRSQELGLENYPTFTRKLYSDVSYHACAKKILAHTDAIYPMFATHNAYSLAAIFSMAGSYRDFEFQCLHGMGDTLYSQIVGKEHLNISCRIYAPCGGHQHLLAYLVRRLLENGANSSFVNRIIDESVPISELTIDPVTEAEALAGAPHPHIPHPRYLFGAQRMNSKGLDLSNPQVLEKLAKDMNAACKKTWTATPMIATKRSDRINTPLAVTNPANQVEVIGHVTEADAKDVELALESAHQAFPKWQKTTAEDRAKILEKMANLLEENMATFMAIAVKEAGKSIANAVGEVREAIDFCRYYAAQVRIHFVSTPFPGPTGEQNRMMLHGRGVVVCISPWNFPLAIFLGEVTAALAAGNVVLAKPAEQTPLIAAAAIELLHKAGIPKDVVQLLPGKGDVVGAKLTSDLRVSGVIFTGSNDTAKLINKALANKEGPIAFFIAETGGQNAMIVDSSALPEQVVTDVISSAYDSAGQRCSALRVLYLQEDIADKVLEMIAGAMDELIIGDPAELSTDIGPVIDKEAQTNLLAHIKNLAKQGGKLIHQAKLSAATAKGTFVPPTLFVIPSIEILKHEVFGPVLHVVRFKAKDLEKVLAEINSTGFGLTFGIHSRINETIEYLENNVHAGNTYVNRNIVGAVVGVQPFGGEGLSGTGPKAGGPHYLPRLAIERVITTNTTAAGGNASLMSLAES